MRARIQALGNAAFEVEGAQFATRHVISALLSKLPDTDVDECLDRLAALGKTHEADLGTPRLRGYLEELQSIREAVALSNRSKAASEHSLSTPTI